MTPLALLLVAVLLYVGSAFLSLLLARAEQLAINAAGIGGVLAGFAGLGAALPVLLTGVSESIMIEGPFAFAHFAVRLDAFAAFMVFVISLLVVITSIYSLAYVAEYKGRGVGAMGFFMNTFIASMLGLVVIDNGFYFLIFFEMMSLASYFLVVFDQNKESVSAGFLYFLIAHAGSVLIMGAFFILYSQTGSLDFAAFRQAHLSGPLASLVFLLAFFGFGAKAGMVPLHSWLPRAHPAAPSHASALMSGVMVKIGVFGIIKVGVDLLGGQTAWWGIVVLGFGAVSAVLGVLYALAERDIKRLLAYSSVENVGIILMGVGTSMIGMATHHPVLAVLGMLAGLYHLLNHAVFKGLLFLGAGSVMYRLHTKDMQQMGGLGRAMPYTAMAFLVGAMAISALPPLNGFVGEWYTYQALFSLSRDSALTMRIAGPLAIVMLAITGALAGMCFVKIYGITFSGAPRSEHAAHAREVPHTMVLAQVLLAVGCVVLGLAAPVVAPIIGKIANGLVAGGAALPVAQGLSNIPGDATQAVLSTPLIAILLLALPLLALLLANALKGARLARRHRGDVWACGYAVDGHMAVSADGFAQPMRFMFAPLYRLREKCNISPVLQASLERIIASATRVEPVWDEYVVAPPVRAVQWIGAKAQCIQHGDFRIYCLYVVVTLLVLLLVAAA